MKTFKICTYYASTLPSCLNTILRVIIQDFSFSFKWMFDPNDISIASKMDLLLLVLLFSAVNGFNIDTSKPVIFNHPGSSIGKYFGYSLTLHTNFDKKW